MKKIIFLLLSFSILPLLSGCTNNDSLQDTNITTVENEENVTLSQNSNFLFSETEFDFGVIKQSGGKVQHDFSFTYTGANPITITGVPTSCACTSATVDTTSLQPGDTGVLTATFNPNLHAEPDGKFFKTIALLTEPKLPETPEVKIWVEIDLDLGPEAFELQDDHDEEEEDGTKGLASYTSLTADTFTTMLENKDFFLVDVHIPEQEHIAETDLITPYNEVEENIDLFPTDKNAKIVLYCRSGPMSRAAAYTLAEHGYTNVYDLSGGKNAYDAFLESVLTEKELRASEKVEYIEFDAIIVTAKNYEAVNMDINGALPAEAISSEKTYVLLTMNNHRDDLSDHDYKNQVTLDGIAPEKWEELANGMGGHHISGLLTFPKVSAPAALTITDLSIGIVNLLFSSSEL